MPKVRSRHEPCQPLQRHWRAQPASEVHAAAPILILFAPGMLQDAGFEVLAVPAGAAHREWLIRPGTLIVEALSWEDANADILALDCISIR
jgi:hypothetical protein